MIRITAKRHSDGLEISAVGHAGFAERGQDIVCAGASALLFGFLAYLQAPLPVATAEGERGGIGTAADGSGDRGGTADAPLPQVGRLEARTEAGILWVRTHGMDPIDTTAWAVTAAGLSLLAEHYPGHVRLDTGKE